MTRQEFLLATAHEIEHSQGNRLRFRSFTVNCAKLLLIAAKRGYAIFETLTNEDIKFMLASVDGEVFRLTGRSYPHHTGLVRSPGDAAIHFLAVLGWLELQKATVSWERLMAAVVAPFVPCALCS